MRRQAPLSRAPETVALIHMSIGDNVADAQRVAKWVMSVGDDEHIEHVDSEFGQVAERDALFQRGRSYPITVEYTGVEPEYFNQTCKQDPDYTAMVTWASDLPACIVIADPRLLLGTHTNPEECNLGPDDPPLKFCDPSRGSGPARMYLPIVDIDIDSDNNDGFNNPSGRESDIEENAPGKIVFISDYDSDGDDVPDFADGIGMGWGTAAPGEVRFVPLKVSVTTFAPAAGVTVTFTYDGSDPSAVTRQQGGAGPPEWYRYTLPAAGRLRLWRKDGVEVRNPSSDLSGGGDFVGPGTAYTLDAIDPDGDGEFVLYIEAARRSDGLGTDSIRLDVVATGGPVELTAEGSTDRVVLTAAEVEVCDLSAWVPELDWRTPDVSPVTLRDRDFDRDGGVRLVQGALTDGASPVLVRLRPAVGLSLDPEVRIVKRGGAFADAPQAFGGFGSIDAQTGVLPPIPYGARTGAVTCGTIIDSGPAIYLPPEAYLDPAYNTGATLNSDEACPMAFEIVSMGVVLSRTGFELRRPPVLLVHGLNSGPDTWNQTIWRSDAEPPGMATRVYKLDYRETSRKGYDDNWHRIPPKVQEMLSEYRSGSLNGKKYAASRVDFVGHSMGAVLARLYASDVQGTHERKDGHLTFAVGRFDGRRYLRANNFFAGDFRRFVSIGAPFLGSRLANNAEDAIKTKAALDYASDLFGDGTGFLQRIRTLAAPRPPGFLDLPRWAGFDDAVIDLQPQSTFQILMDQATYPDGVRRPRWHPIVGVASNAVDSQALPDLLRRTAFYGLFESLSATTFSGFGELNGENGDLVVSVQSQRLGQEGVGTVEGNTVHALADIVNAYLQAAYVSETASAAIAADVRRLLSTDNDQHWQGRLKP